MLKFVITLLIAGALGFNIIAHAKDPATVSDEEYTAVLLKPDIQVKTIYDKLFEHSGLVLKRPLLVDSSRIMNAETNGAVVIVYVGMLNFTIRDRNEDMLAYVLAHEISHIVFNHPYSSKCKGNDYNSRVCEAEADWNAIKLMTDSGYDCTEASNYYTAQIARWGDYDDSASTHPSLSKRAANAETTCKIYKKTGALPTFVIPKEPISGK